MTFKLWIIYGDEIDSAEDLAFEVRRFIAEAPKHGVELSVYRPSQFDLLVTNEDRDSILIDGNPTPLPDFVLPYMDAKNRGYFSLAIIRQLERLGVNVYNNAETIETVSDKLHTHQILAEKDISTPVTMLAKFPVDIDLIESTIGFPVVVKTLHGHLGSGVFLLEDAKGFKDLMNLLGETTPNLQLIFQKFVAASRGRDLRLFVVEGEVIAAMERRAKPGDFKANYSQGGSVHAFTPDPEAENLAIRTAEALNLQIAGIDILFAENNGYTICEANTFPGFKGLEQASGVNVPSKIFSAMKRRLGLPVDTEETLSEGITDTGSDAPPVVLQAI